MKSVFLIVLALLSLTTNLYASDAVLEWDENPDADYYVVYWNTNSKSFSDEKSMEIPGDLNYVDLKESDNGQVYYLTVKAFNAYGNSSDFSATVKAAYVPAEGSVGDVIDTSEVISDLASEDSSVMGAQDGGGGCFIGSLR